MRILFLSLVLTVGSAMANTQSTEVMSTDKGTVRTKATLEFLETEERRGCCSHHGGVRTCTLGVLYCNDGTVSGCGC